MTVEGRRRLIYVVAAAILVAVVAWLLIGRGGDNEGESSPGTAAVSLSELKKEAATIATPVYWVGARSGSEYELTRTEDGRVYIRYLPPGTEAGSSRGDFLTVGTYPQERAFETLKATAKKQGVPTIRLSGGGLAFRDANRPGSVYAAYPGSDYQIEVFEPSGVRAMRLVRAGKVAPLVKPASQAASQEQLENVAAELGHPVYWAGARPEATYELTRTGSGRVYIRYLPPDARVGASKGYLTVGTYPQKNAFANVKARAARLQATTIKVPGNGVAYIDTNRPTSAYIAYPDGTVQVEVYSPDARQTERVVTRGGIRPVG